MKRLEDFSEEIHKCSKCGICQQSCPLYNLTKNDCAVSKGLFIMLEGVIKNRLKLNKNITKYLDLCLKCNKCQQCCPSNIDVIKIILSAKHEYFKNSLEGRIYSVLESKFVFNNFLHIAEKISSIFQRQKKPKQPELAKKAIYFGGCPEKFSPKTRNYVIELLNKMGIGVIELEFDCCGMPFLTTGNLERFQQQLKENVEKIRDLEFDYFITECASCQYAWEQYYQYTDDEVLKNKLENIRYINIYELIAKSDLEFESKSPMKVGYHKPCHEKGDEYILRILENCKNLEVEKLEEKCCGFAAFEHPTALRTLLPMILERGKEIKSKGLDRVLTSCSGCLFSLWFSCFPKPKVSRVITFLKDDTCLKE